MFLVAVTGGIASGKSTVSRMFADLGCPVIDADLIAREVVEPGKRAWYKLRQHFGDEFFHSDGTLDRERLGQFVFSDITQKQILDSITHPEIQKSIIWQLIRYFLRGEQFVIMELPLLFESDRMLQFINTVIVVYWSLILFFLHYLLALPFTGGYPARYSCAFGALSAQFGGIQFSHFFSVDKDRASSRYRHKPLETGRTSSIIHSEEIQRKRLCERTGWDVTTAQQRINAQMPLVDKCRRATVVIDNMADVSQLQQTVNSVHAWLRSRRTHWKLRLILASFVVFAAVVLWTLFIMLPSP